MSKKAVFLLALILLCAIYLRVYNFVNTVNLSTDRAFAFLIADRIINSGHILLVGPVTALSDINILPPTYYYLITFLYYFLRDEVLVSFVFSLFGIFSIILIFLLAKGLAGVKTGLLAALLHTFSLEMITYSRSIWEPHSLPFFTLLSFYLLFLAKRKSQIYLIYLSVFFFFVSLMYVSSYLVLPAYFILTISIYTSLFHDKKKAFLKIVTLFLFSFIISYFPVLIFEYKHNFSSWSKLSEILAGETNAFYFKSSFFFLDSLYSHLKLFAQSIFLSKSFIQNVYLITAVLTFAIIIPFLGKKKNKNYLLFILMPFFTGILLTGFYQKESHAHRLASLYPFFFILLSCSIIDFYNVLLPRKFLNKIFIILSLSLLFLFLKNNIIATKNFIQQTQPVWLHQIRVANYIGWYPKDKPFSIYVILPYDRTNYSSVEYWYQLEKIRKTKLVDLNETGNFIETEIKKNSDYIFLICRDFADYQSILRNCLNHFIRKENLEYPFAEKKIGEAVIFTFKGT